MSEIRNYQSASYKRRLDKLFKVGESINVRETELLAGWSEYLCVRVSGFLEFSIRAILAEYVRGNIKQNKVTRASEYVASFVDSTLDNFQNPKMGNIVELLSKFNPQWGEEIKILTEGKLANQVNSIVATRHQIAHGGPQSISLSVIREYYESAVEVIALIEDICSRTRRY
jgi:RiboL-PSP-HEPN